MVRRGPVSVIWTVGQEVVLRDRDYRNEHTDRPATICRIGRKYVYTVRYGRETPFSIEDGIEHCQGSYPSRIFTPELLAEHDRATAASKRLGLLTRGYGWHNRLSVEAMDQIADIIEATS
jgi:hypothetical protein